MDLFDSDMVQATPLADVSLDVDPVKNIKKKIPWVDKYRPKKLNDIVYQEEPIKVLNECLKTGQFTHMLLYGPPGSGKTSSVLSFVNELYGPNILNKRVIELNASDERGINVVRNKIIGFAKEAVGNPDPDYPSPPFKIIILDEADAMTTEAQSALRTIMESTSGITRFVFICNYINQIIDPIKSRCMKFRFKQISNDAMAHKLKQISQNEKFAVTNDIIDKITDIAKGDIRHGIQLLQYMKYVHDYQGSLTVEDLYKTTNCISDIVIKEIWSILSRDRTNVKDVRGCVQTLREKGYSLQLVLIKIKDSLIMSDLSDKEKASMCFMIGDSEKMLLDGADETLQILNVFLEINRVYSQKRNYNQNQTRRVL